MMKRTVYQVSLKVLIFNLMIKNILETYCMYINRSTVIEFHNFNILKIFL